MLARIIFLSILASSVFTTTLHSQFSIGLSFGYGFKWDPRNIEDGQLQYHPEDSSTYYEPITISYGEGYYLSAELGYKTNRYIQPGLGIHFLIGDGEKAHFRTKLNEYFVKYNGNILLLCPNVKISVPFYRVNVFGRFGPNIATLVSTERKAEGMTLLTNEVYTSDVKIKYSGVSFGMSASIGIEWKLNEKVQLVTEIFNHSLAFNPKISTRVKDDYNGVDQLPMMNYSEKNIVYVSDAIFSHSQNVNEARILPEKRLPFSSLGLKLGVIYNFTQLK